MKWLQFTMSLVVSTLMIGCFDSPNKPESEDDTVTPNEQELESTGSEFHNEFLSLLYGKSKFNYQSEYYNEELKDSSTVGDYKVYYFNVDAADNVPSLEVFGQNDDILWPGQILSGDQFAANKSYKPISLTRTPVTLSLSLESSTTDGGLGGVSLRGVVEKPTLSTVRQEINNIISQNGSATLAPEFSYEYENILDQAQLQIGLSSILGSNELTNKLGIDWSDTQVRSRLVFTFKQRAFSVDMDTPDSVFSSANSIENLRAQLSGNISPLYVSSIDYGAAFYMVVESDLDANSLKAALNLGHDNANLNNGSISQNTKVRVAQFGGSSSLHDQLVDAVQNGNGIPDIENILSTQTLATSNAVPISYKMRYLSDHSIAEVAIASEYQKKVYLKINQEVQVTLEKFDFRDSDGSGGPEGSSSVSFIKKYMDSTGVLQSETIANWSGGVQDVSPNISYTTTFTNYNPETDYVYVSIHVIEEDAFDNDHAYGNQSFYIDSWEGQSYDVDASGNGAASRITVKFNLK